METYRRWYKLLALLLFAVPAFGQGIQNIKGSSGYGPPSATDPLAQYGVGTQFTDLNSGILYVCTAVTIVSNKPSCTWSQVGTNAVSSVFTRTGAVAAQSGDYTCAQVTSCGPGGGPVAGLFNWSTNCTGLSNCFQGTDDDSTDNCGTALTTWLTAVNAYAGKGIPQVWIGGSGAGKAYKLATSGCNLTFSNSKGVDVHLWATIDCAQVAQGCIQLAATNTSGSTVTNTETLIQYRLDGGGGLIGGASLSGSGGNGSGTAAGVYIMPTPAAVVIDGLFFGGSGASAQGFGATTTMGSCTNWSIYFDFPMPTAVVTNVSDFVNSADTTHGGCGMGNPNGASTGSNTIFWDKNLVTTYGEASGTGFCGSVGINDGGTLGVASENNIFGFGIPILLQGVGHRTAFNQIDSTQCAAGGVSAAIQFGGSSVTVGPIDIIGNVVQLGTSQFHAAGFVAIANGATPTLEGINIISNMNNNTSTTNAPIYSSPAPCTVLGHPCEVFDNFNMVQFLSQCGGSAGWQTDNLVVYCYNAAQAANVGATTIYVAPSTTPAYLASCQVVLSRVATVSSTLPTCAITWTDATTSVVETATITSTWASGAFGCSGGTTNTLGNSCQGTILIQPSASTNVQYSTSSYASSGATTMQYAVTATLQRQ